MQNNKTLKKRVMKNEVQNNRKMNKNNRKSKKVVNNALKMWTDHLLKWSKEHNMSYGDAMRDSKCKAAFKKNKGKNL